MTAQHARLTLVDYSTVSRAATAAEIGRTAVQWCLDPASRSEAAPIRQFYQEEESFLSIKNNNKTIGGVPCVRKDCQP